MAVAVFLPAVLGSAVACAAAQDSLQPQAQPDVRSHAFYVLDESDAKVLAARHEHVPVPIASITKLMTALAVLEAGQPMDEMLAITADDVRGTPGSHSRLAPGARLSREDLLRLALMSSENRATHALCRRYPDGLPACIRAMNDRAAALGMSSARFVEPTGLSSRNVASPEDLAKLVLAASGNPLVRDYSTAASHTVLVNRQQLEYHNTNLLVGNPSWQVSVQKTSSSASMARARPRRSASWPIAMSPRAAR